MLRRSIFVLMTLLASGAHAATDPLDDLTKGQPKDVAAVVKRIALCNHFGGEEPYDAARRKEINAALTKYRCEKIDKDEAAMRKRYKDSPAVLGVLDKAQDW